MPPIHSERDRSFAILYIASQEIAFCSVAHTMDERRNPQEVKLDMIAAAEQDPRGNEPASLRSFL